MTWNEKKDMLGEINIQAASILRTFYEPAAPMKDSAGGDVCAADLEEIKRARIVLGLTKLRKLASLAVVKFADEEGGPG